MKAKVKRRKTEDGRWKAAAGRKGRGVDAFSPKMGKSRKDPGLQARIDMVVKMAKAHEVDHSVDVMNNDRHTIRHTTLKVIRVG